MNNFQENKVGLVNIATEATYETVPRHLPAAQLLPRLEAERRDRVTKTRPLSDTFEILACLLAIMRCSWCSKVSVNNCTSLRRCTDQIAMFTFYHIPPKSILHPQHVFQICSNGPFPFRTPTMLQKALPDERDVIKKNRS